MSQLEASPAAAEQAVGDPFVLAGHRPSKDLDDILVLASLLFCFSRRAATLDGRIQVSHDGHILVTSFKFSPLHVTHERYWFEWNRVRLPFFSTAPFF